MWITAKVIVGSINPRVIIQSLFAYLVTRQNALHTFGSKPRESIVDDADYTAPNDKTATRLTKIITSFAVTLSLKHLSSNAPASPQTTNPTSIVLYAAHLCTLQALTRTSATLTFFSTARTD